MRIAARHWLLLGAIGLVWSVLLGRAFQVQVLQHAHWEEAAQERQGQIRPLPAARGEILSADGVRLAHSVSNHSLAVDPALVRDAHALALALEEAGVVDAASFEDRLREHEGRRFLWVTRDVVPELVLQDLSARFPELVMRLEEKRLYPGGQAGGSLIGVVNSEGHALGGLEHEFDAQLAGTDGSILEVSDRTGKRFQGLEQQLLSEPQAGHSIQLSLQSRIQEIAADALGRALAEQRATSAFVIVTRPQTGEILALVSLPGVDPLDASTWTDGSLSLRPVVDQFEPGSIYKIVAFAAALEAGRLSPDEIIDCLGGERPMPGGPPIRDHEPYELLTAAEVMQHSSNIGTGIIAERVGAEGFHRMERSFGFGLPSGVELPGEGRGRIPDPSAFSGRSLVTMAFGQELSATGMQLAMAYGAIANGGNLMRPWLIQEIRGADGSLLESRGPEVVRRVLRPETAHTMRRLLRGVVEDGTALKAEIEGYEPAGKTGTAQKYIPELGRYSKERYVASFIGFAPWEDPEVLCAVVLDEPRGDIYGGNVAAPVFREIVSGVRNLLREPEIAQMRSPAHHPETQRQVPEVMGLSAAVARRVVQENGFLPRFEGSGAWVTALRPEAGRELPPGGVVTMVLSGDDGAVMPALAGLPLRDALLRVDSVGGVAHVSGAGWVIGQRPAPGSTIEAGEACWLELGADSSRAWKEFQEIARRASGQLAARALPGEPASENDHARRRHDDHRRAPR
ncbi:MAG: penicillin-binding transpeptidase domain-containing protein [Candidatus Eisenbacteria bacterium]